MRASNRRSCSFLPTSSQNLMRMIPPSTMYFSTTGQFFEETPYCFLGAEAHHALDAGAVVPTAVEDHDFAGGGKVLHVPLHVHLRLLPVGRGRQRDQPEDARADAFGDRLDRAALAGRVAALEDDDHPQPLVLHPLLQAAEFGLELAQFLLVLLAFHLGFGFVPVGLFHDFTSRSAFLAHDSAATVRRPQSLSRRTLRLCGEFK